MIALIPSKGRVNTSTYKLLMGSGFTVYHFIEPQEIDAYDVPNKISILEDNRGITYVRNFMLEWAKAQGHKTVLICDDDINSFGMAKNKRAGNRPNAEAIVKPFTVFSKSTFALAGVNQRQFAWSETKPYRVNSGKVNGCIFANLNKITWKYRENTKEDIDFAMQCLSNRQSFIFFCKVFYNSPAVGTNKGGLHESYVNKYDSIWAKQLHLDWINHSKIIEQYGRVDCRVDFKKLAKEMGLDVI